MPDEVRHLCHSAAAAVPAAEVRYLLRGMPAAGARSEEAPVRFKVANWGLETFRGGSVLVNDHAVAEIRRRMAAARQDRVRIDIAHTTSFRPAAQMQPENILGYADLEAVPDDGLYLCNAAWTDRGKAIWRALPDPSPAFLCRKSDHLMTQLDSVGLCPDGELELPTLCSADPDPTPPGIYLQTVTESAMILTEAIIALLKKAGVKVPEKGTMTDAEYEAALAAAAIDSVGKTEEKTEEKPAESPMALSAVVTQMKELEKKVAGWQGREDKAAKDEILRKCSAEGKVMPLTNEQIYGTATEQPVALSAMEAIYTNLQPTVAVKTGTAARSGDTPKPGEAKHTLSADQLGCLSRMGVTPAEVPTLTAA